MDNKEDKITSGGTSSSESPVYMGFKLASAEKVWLEAVYDKLRKNEEVVPTQMLVQLLGRIPTDFKYKDIDPRLILWGIEITLLGILQIDPDTDLVSKTDTVIRCIKQAIIEDSKIARINTEVIAHSTGLSKGEVSIIFRLLPHLGDFWNGGFSDSTGYKEIGIAYEATVREYLSYDNIDKLLLKLYQRKDLRISISEDEQPRESVKIVLDFPEEVEVYCEQYLVYFVQFLKDLGVSATSELKHEAGKVLFSVTPTDQNEALDKIRSALEVYLALPSEKLTHSSDNPVEVQRLSANIHHLQGQLSIAQAVLQAEEAAIQAQQISINNLLSENVIDITPKKAEDKEEFLGGTIALTKYQNKGVEINLAEIFRKLKRLFQKS
jgi:hypothetical protein